MRGDRVGIVGPNGSGKTTLLKLLLKELEPQSGTIRHGVNLQAVYFDQMRSELDPDKNVIENLGEGYETIELNGRKKHIMAYLQDFLFSPDRAKSPVAHLSGGERNRLLLAKLFARPANLLILDEPTNDLDVETLELLEERLVEFAGTVIVISHDREFLDNVVTDTVFLDGSGKVREFVGGYTDWRRQGGRFPAEAGSRAPKSNKTPARPAPPAQQTKAVKLSHKLKLELEELPKKIEALEAELAQLQGTVGAPEFYSGPSDEVSATLEKMLETQSRLDSAMERWMELEEQANQ
jgi:ATP-binding cassette subfamily F protein uup